MVLAHSQERYMEFEQLEQDYQDDHLANALYEREKEWFHYNFDRVNFERMLAVMPPSTGRDALTKRLADTNAQMVAVDLVYAALKSQIRSAEAHAAAVERTKAKRAAVK